MLKSKKIIEKITVVPKHLHGFIIGTKGSILKDIQQKSGPDVVIFVGNNNDSTQDPNLITIGGDVQTNVQKARQQIMKIYDQHKHKVDVNSASYSKTLPVPSNLHKYVIGANGATLKQIEKDTHTKVNIITTGKGSITVVGNSNNQVDQAIQKLLNSLESFGWYYNANSQTFVEQNEMDKVFAQFQVKVDKEAQLRGECYEKAKKAFDSGNKALAKQLSEEGKKHQELMEKYQKEASQKIFEYCNAKHNHDIKIIDLHGQHVEIALQFLEERIKLAKSKKLTKLTIIPGAGNHSENNKAKIKPAIIQFLNQRKINYKQVNEGQFDVDL